jgi:hypothetical protein
VGGSCSQALYLAKGVRLLAYDTASVALPVHLAASRLRQYGSAQYWWARYFRARRKCFSRTAFPARSAREASESRLPA